MEELSYEELKERYKKIKHYLFMEGIELPLKVEPYTKKEYQTRNNIPQLYWGKRDYEAIQWEKEGKADWLESILLIFYKNYCIIFIENKKGDKK